LNYYPHHIGDYAAATEHLSWLEDMAYTRLIRLYYRTEKPIPSDRAVVYRLVRASGSQERKAVDAVLSEFFVLTDDGYRQKRCDEELLRMQEKSNKARASVEKRWQYERNTNVSTNEHTNVLRTGYVGNTPNNQEPITNNQEPKEKVNTSCPEPSKKPARSRPAQRWNGVEIIRLPVVGAPEPEVPITREFVDEMQAAYPAVDVEATLPEIRAWCVANPARRKTPSGIYRFVQSWLSREQNRG
jgi:uncharacterized protein YdaU (DUF1376 family)